MPMAFTRRYPHDISGKYFPHRAAGAANQASAGGYMQDLPALMPMPESPRRRGKKDATMQEFTGPGDECFRPYIPGEAILPAFGARRSKNVQSEILILGFRPRV